jgi:hypothetical protein
VPAQEVALRKEEAGVLARGPQDTGATGKTWRMVSLMEVKLGHT